MYLVWRTDKVHLQKQGKAFFHLKNILLRQSSDILRLSTFRSGKGVWHISKDTSNIKLAGYPATRHTVIVKSRISGKTYMKILCQCFNASSTTVGLCLGPHHLLLHLGVPILYVKPQRLYFQLQGRRETGLFKTSNKFILSCVYRGVERILLRCL